MTQSNFPRIFAKLKLRAVTLGLDERDHRIDPKDFKDGRAFVLIGVDRDGAEVVVPSSVERGTFFGSDPANLYPVTIRCGTGALSIEPGQWLAVATDGTLNGIDGTELTGAVSLSAWQRITAAMSPYQAKPGEHLDIDTTDGAVTVVLPAEPARFNQVFFSNIKGTFTAHPLTVARHADRVPDYTIDDAAANLTAGDDGDEFSLVYDDDGSNWMVRVYP